MDDLDLVRQACPVINDTGWAYYFTAETMARGNELGFKGPQFYFAGRGGLLGDCDASVVSAAFGYFNPDVVRRAWESARDVCAPRDAGRAHWACCADLGRARLAGVAGLAEFVAAADEVNDAADPDGLALYSAFRSEPMVADLPGRAMQLVAILREYRGSAHLVAVRAAGLTSKQAHFLKRPGDVKMFGWSDEDAPTMPADASERMERAERITDDIVLPAYAVLDGGGRRALVDGIRAIQAALRAG
jgi:hypothetical protein